ncbi:PRA1 family protein 3 [Nibea albiflora]|uniref:PRA1 family protein 3 n=1 Tax=Nibea albiflora TaxID=240163 RepID=A0ACB7EYH9_NIBAL|nr:PRA1 family protein 3 [Nibea albiflora]
MAKVELTPLRPWDDFFPGSERFAKPDGKDLAKWNNRVVSNLLYYQTNYLALAIVVSWLSVIFAHASFRLRNMKNKLENKIEGAGLKEVTHGDFAGGSGSAGGKLSKDPELSGGKTEGVIGLDSF